jgi:peptidoglycan/LPS O-acetylase OafA/YrhL
MIAHSATNQKYRPDIDGLRAIAILSVIGFHAFPSWIPGGFIGVDIFFVISGFLISTILYSNLNQDNYSFFEFYGRRIKRIFPALLLILMACYVFGWFSLLADEYKQLGKGIAGGAGFISNFILWRESGYFDNSAEMKPLLHLWSLGIEEQFYILWPVVLWCASKQRFNLITVAIVLATISFAINLNNVGAEPTATFYSPVTRIWELLCGSILAHLMLYPPKVKSEITKTFNRWSSSVIYSCASEQNGKTLQNTLAITGIVLIAGASLFFTKNVAFPGWRAAIPVLGATLLIAAGPETWFNRVVLSQKAIVGIGLISYPLYLWHWPLLSFARIFEGAETSLPIRVTAVTLSFVLAFLTYHLIEKPIRFGKYKTPKTVALIVLMTATGFVGYNTYRRNGMEFRVAQFAKIFRAAGEWEYPGKMAKIEFQGHPFYVERSARKETTLFIGDSNIEQYYSRIDALIKAAPEENNSAIFSTGGGCIPIPNASNIYKYCDGYMDASMNFAVSNNQISTVVIGGLWYLYLSGQALTYYVNNGQKYPMQIGAKGLDYGLDQLGMFIRDLKSKNKRVVLMLNIPIGDSLDPKFLVERSVTHPFNFKIRQGGIVLSQLENKYLAIKTGLIRIANENGIETIDPTKYLCKNDICPSLSGGSDPRYKDGFHLRPSFVKNDVNFIDVVMKSHANSIP